MDKNIDHQETQTYGPRFSANIRRLFSEGAVGPLLAFMLWCAEQLDAATETLRVAMAARRTASSKLTAAAEDKLPAVEEGRAELKAFTLHLAAMKADKSESWNGDLELFAPGGLSSVGKGARNVRDAHKVARGALHDDLSVPERAKWLKRLDAQVKALDPLVTRGDDAGHAHNTTLSEQSAEKRAWLRVYRGVALVLEGVLLMTGREGEYTAAVPHLTAPGTRKKTEAATVNVSATQADTVRNLPMGPARPSQPARPV